MSHPSVVPLHRLLNRREMVAVLEEFVGIAPAVDLLLLDAEGQLFAGVSDWLPDERSAWLEQARAGQPLILDGCRIVPLLDGESLLGVLAARGPLDDPAVQHALRCLERSLALLLAEALEKRSIARETLDRYREVNLLYNIGETIGTCLDPQEIPRLVLREASRIIRADVGVVLLSAAGGVEGLKVENHFGPAESAAALCQGACGLVEQVCLSGQPAIVADLSAGQPGFGAVLCAPLRTQERVLGVILLGRLAHREVFAAADEKLLMALVGQAAIAIENARLFDDVRRQRDAIAEMKSYMDSIFASITSGVITTDVESLITTLNRAAERILGVRAEEAIGQSYVEGLPGLGRAIISLVSTVRRQDEPVRGYELESDLPLRGQAVLRLHISPLKDSQLVTTGVAIVVDDLTERRQLEQQVRRVRETFERYVAPHVVERLLSDPSSVWLGGVLREITTLYADIRDFTTYSERVAPEQQIETLNQHLTAAA